MELESVSRQANTYTRGNTFTSNKAYHVGETRNSLEVTFHGAGYLGKGVMVEGIILRLKWIDVRCDGMPETRTTEEIQASELGSKL